MSIKDTEPKVYYGGTFDPLHIGHIQPVQDALKAIDVDSLTLMPCHIPPHKASPEVNAHFRLSMLEQYANEHAWLSVDSRELLRHTPSYTIDTLKELRKEYLNQPVIFIIGMDSLKSLDKWYQWQDLLNYCHLLVCRRGSEQPVFNDEVTHLLNKHQVKKAENLRTSLAGHIYLAPTREIAISSSELREMIRSGNNVSEWIPQTILNYIRERELYVK